MKLIYKFRQGKAEGNKSMADTLGGKGANLAEMCNLGLPIPAGMTIPTEVWKANALIDCVNAVKEALFEMAEGTGPTPLVSVRSGARVSMPGMMDTVLNVGMTVDNIDYWRKELGDETALDCFRRLIEMYANVVHDVPTELFAEEAEDVPLISAVDKYLELYEALIGAPFPNNLNDQLQDCIEAVWKSWDSPRAIKYREAHGIPNDWGTAVNIQQMVFGNKNDNSGSGVLFSRNPSTGEPGLYGEYLINAQGEDVVAGTRNPESLDTMANKAGLWSSIHGELQLFANGMESHYHDMQDMEFTVEDGTLYILQTRSGKRSAQAAFRIAHDMVQEGLITKDEAIQRVNGKQYLVLNKPAIDPSFNVAPTFTGIPAAGHIVTGKAVLSAKAAEKCKEPCILVTKETTPNDFGGMMASVGILTRTGGATSHAAVVARGMNKTCVVGATGAYVTAGDTVTLDGATGRVWVDTEVPVVKQQIEHYAEEIIGWALGTGANSYLLKITPKVGAVAKQWQEEIESFLPIEGRVYIDCSHLPGRKKVKQVPNSPFKALIKVLKSRPKLTGILGLGFRPDSEVDRGYLERLGVSEAANNLDGVTGVARQVAVLPLKAWPKKLRSAWFIHLLRDFEFSESVLASEWGCVHPVETVGDLLKADGVVDLRKETIVRFKAHEGVEAKDLIALLEKAGRRIELLPPATSKERVIFESLGKVGKV